MSTPLDFLLKRLTTLCVLLNIFLEAKRGKSVIRLEKSKIVETCCRHDPDLCLDREIVWLDMQLLLPHLSAHRLIEEVRLEGDSVKLKLSSALLRAAAASGTLRDFVTKIRTLTDRSQAALVDIVYSVLRDYVKHEKTI